VLPSARRPLTLVLASESLRRWQRGRDGERRRLVWLCGLCPGEQSGRQSGCVLWSLTVDALLDLLLLLYLLAQCDRAAVSWAYEACQQAPDRRAATA
jgi:hypothetical protein